MLSILIRYVITYVIDGQNDSLNCNLELTVTLSSVLSQLNLIIPSSSHKSWQSTNPNLVTQQRYHKLISISYLIFQDCHYKQPPQTQVSSALELTLLTSEVIFVTIFGMAGMNLGTSVSAATRSASKFRAGVIDGYMNMKIYNQYALQQLIGFGFVLSSLSQVDPKMIKNTIPDQLLFLNKLTFAV
ncbi:Hypothetical_protein [Hexamita inflata]|uniref:Hypothetical_protein n=1 Tax=Hexamita inflata TaxID=28002 RepID=A0AA86TV91_9EUKA|nr:Hypothetical protein HINF_LOCUS10533 [Hexamita inflata]